MDAYKSFKDLVERKGNKQTMTRSLKQPRPRGKPRSLNELQQDRCHRKRGGLKVRAKVTHNPMREIAVSTSLQCVSFLSSSSSEWAIVEDSISLVVSDQENI